MKRTNLQTNAAHGDWQEQMDQDEAKEVSQPPAEIGKFMETQCALEAAGYRILQSEILKVQPIWYFRLDRASASRFRNGDRLTAHVLSIAEKAGLLVDADNVMIQPEPRGRLIISFLWDTPARGKKREQAWEAGRFETFSRARPWTNWPEDVR